MIFCELSKLIALIFSKLDSDFKLIEQGACSSQVRDKPPSQFATLVDTIYQIQVSGMGTTFSFYESGITTGVKRHPGFICKRHEKTKSPYFFFY